MAHWVFPAGQKLMCESPKPAAPEPDRRVIFLLTIPSFHFPLSTFRREPATDPVPANGNRRAMKAKAIEIRWHNTKPIYSTDFQTIPPSNLSSLIPSRSHHPYLDSELDKQLHQLEAEMGCGNVWRLATAGGDNLVMVYIHCLNILVTPLKGSQEVFHSLIRCGSFTPNQRWHKLTNTAMLTKQPVNPPRPHSIQNQFSITSSIATLLSSNILPL